MKVIVDLVFYYGKWQCFGKIVVLMEFNKIFVEVCVFLKVGLFKMV